jgi:energy-converting hydrogenase Eha subunit B
MSLIAMSMNAGQRLATSAVLAVTDPDATAPAELQAKTNVVLGMVKWGSLMAVLGLFLAAGMISLAGDRGYGGGMSPELKSSVMKGVIALVIVGSAAQIVTFVSG